MLGPFCAQVLDDNMMLCLANGERIRLKPSMRLLFEVQDLEQASPATVSRLGVVYFAPDSVGWMAIVQSWVQVHSVCYFVLAEPPTPDLPLGLFRAQSPAASRTMCAGIRERVVSRMLSLLRLVFAAIKRDGFRQLTPCVEVNVVASMCLFFQACCVRENANLTTESIVTYKVPLL